MIKKKYNLLIVGNPISDASTEAFLRKFLNVLDPLSKNIYLISGDRMINDHNITWIKPRYILKNDEKVINIMRYFLSQLHSMLLALKLSKKIDLAVILPTPYILPIIALKLKNKKVIVFAAQRSSNALLEVLEKLNFILSDLIIVESEGIIKDLNLIKYREKIVKGNMYVDTKFFRNEKDIRERGNIVGYIGTLNTRKGVEKLIEAIPNVVENHSDLEFLIGGIGPFENIMKKISNTNNNVNFIGQVPQKDLPKHFNDMKLFVLPSLSEGVPNVILEAMACGTPVLATPVGGTPDVITDGDTGFIMENNSPECIVENVESALNYPKLDKIVENARKLIEKEYTYEAAVGRYKKILDEMSSVR